MAGFEEGLHAVLLKTEIEYRAKHGECWQDSMVAGLDGSSPQALAKDLRRIGFRVAEIVDDVDCDGKPERWVETTNGVMVFAWTDDDVKRGERRCFIGRCRRRRVMNK